MWGLKEKTNSDNKQTNKRNKQHKKREKEIPSQPDLFFRKIFHKTYDKVFRHMNNKKKTEEMALCQNYKVFC